MHAQQCASKKKRKKATDDWARRSRVQVPVSVVALRRSGREGETNAAEREERATEPRHPGQGEVRTQHGLLRVGSSEASKDSNPYETEAHGSDSGTVITNSRCAALHCQNPEKLFR